MLYFLKEIRIKIIISSDSRRKIYAISVKKSLIYIFNQGILLPTDVLLCTLHVPITSMHKEWKSIIRKLCGTIEMKLHKSNPRVFSIAGIYIYKDLTHTTKDIESPGRHAEKVSLLNIV